MGHESLARARVALRQIGKTPSRSHAVLPHAPEACDGGEVVTTRGRAAMEATRAMGVVEGRVELVRPMAPTALDDHHPLLRGWAEGRHPVVPLWAQRLRIKGRHDGREDLRGALVDGADDAEPHPTGPPTPRALRPPCWPCATLVPFALTGTQRPCGQARALGVAPPARPGEGTTPEAGVLFREHQDLPLTSPRLERGQCERSPRPLSGGRSEPSRGAAVGYVFFVRTSRTLARLSGTPGWRARTVASS